MKQSISISHYMALIARLLFSSSLVLSVLVTAPAVSADLAFDPTRPSAYVPPKVVKKRVVKTKPKKTVSRYTLQSILISENRRVATINNKAYIVGEKLEGGAILTNVMPDYVEIKRYSKKKKIPLINTQIRQ